MTFQATRTFSVIFLIAAAILLGNPAALGIPKCDSACRERYTFLFDGEGGTICFNWELKECTYCKVGLCNVTVADPKTDGTCTIDNLKTQRYKVAACTLICALNPGSYAEALFVSSANPYKDAGAGPTYCK